MILEPKNYVERFLHLTRLDGYQWRPTIKLWYRREEPFIGVELQDSEVPNLICLTPPEAEALGRALIRASNDFIEEGDNDVQQAG